MRRHEGVWRNAHRAWRSPRATPPIFLRTSRTPHSSRRASTTRPRSLKPNSNCAAPDLVHAARIVRALSRRPNIRARVLSAHLRSVSCLAVTLTPSPFNRPDLFNRRQSFAGAGTVGCCSRRVCDESGYAFRFMASSEQNRLTASMSCGRHRMIRRRPARRLSGCRPREPRGRHGDEPAPAQSRGRTLPQLAGHRRAMDQERQAGGALDAIVGSPGSGRMKSDCS